MLLLRLLKSLSVLASLCAAPVTMGNPVIIPTPRPLVFWHGLGDAAQAPGVFKFMDEIKEVHPDIFIHAVYIMETEEEDRKAGFFGDLDLQLQFVHEELKTIGELQDGFDAIGFSQGGQFLRAYQQIYNAPPMHNLITFGSQHMGISELPACATFDVLCHLLHRLARGQVYSEWAQKNLIPAQYFRDPARLSVYYTQNHWLPLINNELLERRNATYAENLTKLENLVLVMFTNDTTVVPKESGFFGSYAPVDDFMGETPPIVSMRDQPLYKEDWIGLRTLDERGAVIQVTCPGVHLYMPDACWKPLVEKYVGEKVVPGENIRAGRLLVQ